MRSWLSRCQTISGLTRIVHWERCQPAPRLGRPTASVPKHPAGYVLPGNCPLDFGPYLNFRSCDGLKLRVHSERFCSICVHVDILDVRRLLASEDDMCMTGRPFRKLPSPHRRVQRQPRFAARGGRRATLNQGSAGHGIVHLPSCEVARRHSIWRDAPA
jgi:hypothetical protein